MSKTAQQPYIDNRQKYSSVLQNVSANSRGWRIATYTMALITLCSVAGVVYIGSQSKIKPVVIEIDGYGTPMRLYKVDEGTNTTDQRIVKAALAQVVSAVRSVSIDAAVQKREMDDIIHFFEKGEPGFSRIQAYITDPKNNPFQRAKKELVDVQVNNVIKLTDNSWQVEWTERTRDRTGQPISKVSFKATVTVGYADEISASTIYINPTGLLIKDIVWSQQVN